MVVPRHVAWARGDVVVMVIRGERFISCGDVRELCGVVRVTSVRTQLVANVLTQASVSASARKYAAEPEA